jgi:hypothetical protein
MKYLAEELNANFTQVWAIMIFSGRKEAEYGVNTGGPRYLPFLRIGPGANYYAEPKYDLTATIRPTSRGFMTSCGRHGNGHLRGDHALRHLRLKQGGNWYGAFDPRWSSNPFHPDNNINDLGLPKDHALGKDRFFI